MGSKLKSIFKRQVSQPVKSEMKNTEEANSIMQEMKSLPNDFLQRRKFNGKSYDLRDNKGSDDSVVLRRKIGPRRHNTSLGAIEDLLQCPICQDRLKSPRMMPCQHTFCQKCLEKQLDRTIGNRADIALSCPLCNVRVSARSPDLLPTNLYIESLLNVMENPGEGWLRLGSRSPVVSFAPLPEKNFESGTNAAPPKSSVFPCLCLKCSIPCSKDNRCRHCKQIFCDSCWLSHIDELKVQLEKIIPQLESASCRFDNRIDEFRAKIDELRVSIEKDTETRIAELMQERDERIVRLNNQAAKGEESAKEAQRRIYKISNDLKEQTNGLYDSLDENNSKVKVFMSLHREATELMNLESSWNPELGEDDVIDSSMKISHVDLMNSRGDVDLFYRRKTFAPKLVLSREIVQRPSGMSHDPWRDHVFVACPGARQIVVLDRKYKLFKRYQSTEMMAPQGLAYVETTEELFVTDKWKHCIFVFNRNGQVVRNMCKKGQSESQLSSPEGMTFYPRKNLLYVADTGNDRIQILELNGTFRGFIGPTERKAHCVTKSGKISFIAMNHLNQPTGVSVTDDCVIVADCGNHKIKIFNHEGMLVRTIGGSGTLKRHFRSPEVVQVDSKGNIIVGDSGNARVQIFSPQGDLLRVLGGRTSNSNKFGWISGLLVKNNFEILIGDNKTNAVKIF